MDPNATWEELIACLSGPDRDIMQAVEHAEALHSWLRKGGFVPEKAKQMIAGNTSGTSDSSGLLVWLTGFIGYFGDPEAMYRCRIPTDDQLQWLYAAMEEYGNGDRDPFHGLAVHQSDDGKTIWIPLPKVLARVIKLGCDCHYCKAHPEELPRWDTLCISATRSRHGQRTSVVHYPNCAKEASLHGWPVKEKPSYSHRDVGFGWDFAKAHGWGIVHEDKDTVVITVSGKDNAWREITVKNTTNRTKALEAAREHLTPIPEKNGADFGTFVEIEL